MLKELAPLYDADARPRKVGVIRVLGPVRGLIAAERALRSRQCPSRQGGTSTSPRRI